MMAAPAADPADVMLDAVALVRAALSLDNAAVDAVFDAYPDARPLAAQLAMLAGNILRSSSDNPAALLDTLVKLIIETPFG